MRRKLNKGTKLLYLFIVLAFMYLPIIFLAIASFDESKLGTGKGFTLKWYAELFSRSDVMDALWVTVSIAVFATAISTVVGTAAAIGFYGMRKRTSRAMTVINNFPMMNPDIVTGISLMLLFAFIGIRRGYVTLLLAHLVFCIPYVVLAVLPKLKTMNPHLYEAALDMGATPSKALMKVVIPQIRPGIITGALLAFTMSLDDFAVSFFTGGTYNTLSTYIYSCVKTGIEPYLNALSVLMFLVILILMIFINKRADLTELY